MSTFQSAINRLHHLIVRYATLCAALLALVAVCHRYILAAHQYILVADTGTLALMAQNILKGERPLFLYGFSYSGAPLAYIVALFFRLFGTSLTSLVLPAALLAGVWVWLTFLLVRRLAGPRAAIAAALLATFTDRTTSWYTHTPDTSYTLLLPAGAFILWFALEIEHRDWHGLPLLLALSLLGAVAGIALWSNAIIAPWLLVAVIPLACLLWRARFRPATLFAFLCALLAFSIAAAPLIKMLQRSSHSTTLTWQLAPAHIWYNFKLIFSHTLTHYYAWSHNISLANAVGRPFTLLAALLALGTWYRMRRHTLRHAATLLPLLILVFLLCYLPHSMASENVPRYLLPFWTTFITISLALPQASSSRLLRRSATILTLFWIGWNCCGAINLLPVGQLDRSQRLARRAAITAAAKELSASHVTLLGDYFFQAEANALTFLAAGDVTYVSPSRERYLPHAQAAERDPGRIYLAHTNLLGATRASLTALNATWRETPIDAMATLIHDIEPSPTTKEVIPADRYTIKLDPAISVTASNSITHLLPGSISAAGATPHMIEIDFAAPQLLSGLDLMPATADGLELPTHLRLDYSIDGTNYHPLASWQGYLPVAYQAGPHIYLGGGHGRASHNFPPLQLRQLRLTLGLPSSGYLAHPPPAPPLQQPDLRWSLAAIRLFAPAPPLRQPVPAPLRESAAIGRFLNEMEVIFTACDRWLITQLSPLAQPYESGTTFPLFENPTALLGDACGLTFMRLQALPNVAVIVAREVAPLQETLFERNSIPRNSWWRTDHGHYTSFIFMPHAAAPTFTWDGTLLTTSGDFAVE